MTRRDDVHTPTQAPSRREFLSAAGAVLFGSLVSACSGVDPEVVRQQAAEYAGDYSCQNVAGFLEAELQTRKVNEYVDQSAHETQFCFNCTNFKPTSGPDKRQCAGCTTVNGPIHPLGWCKAWTLRA